MISKPKILLVEDDTPLAMMVVHVLTRADCDVLVANTGKKGMELAHENKFSLIVLDMDLPDGSGLEICDELKQRHLTRLTPIILVCARQNEEDRRRGFELGAVDYIAKPFDGPDFATRILSHVESEKGFN